MAVDMEKISSFVSVVCVIKNAAVDLASNLREIEKVLKYNFTDYEIILIDQASRDHTEEIVEQQLVRISCIRYLRLTQEVAKDVAMAAGAENAIGDFIVFLTLQTDPVELILPVVEKCREGSDIVVGVVKDYNASLGYKLLRPYAGQILGKIIAYNIPAGATDFYCLSRRAANVVMNIKSFHHKFLFRISCVGYPLDILEYSCISEKRSKKTLFSSFDRLFQLLIFNSTKPLRFISFMGFSGSILTFIASLYTLLIKIFKENVAAGWATIMLFLSLMFAIVFIILALFGEYLGRMLDDNLNEKHYDVLFEKNSSVMFDENRHNVMSDSISGEINRVQTGRDR